jgi:hypothetical protein
VICGARVLATPCSQFLNLSLTVIGTSRPRPAGGDWRGGQLFIGGAVVARGGDRWARPYTRLLAHAGDRAGSPPQSSGSIGG